MKYLYFIRHGNRKNKDKNKDSSLTALGRKQAKETAEYLNKIGIDIIFSSPSKKTLETAEIISNNLHLPLQKKPCLKENKNETTSKKTKEIKEFINRLDNSLFERPVLISHGSTIADFITAVFSKEYLQQHEKLFLKKGKYAISESSITIFKKDKKNREWKLVKIGFTDHLKKINDIKLYKNT